MEKYHLAVSSFGCALNFLSGRNVIRSYDNDVLLVDWKKAPEIWVILRRLEKIPEKFQSLIHSDFPDSPPAQGAVYCRGMKEDSEKILCLESLEAMAFNGEKGGLLVADCFDLNFAALLVSLSDLLRKIKKSDYSIWEQTLGIDLILGQCIDPTLKLKAIKNNREDSEKFSEMVYSNLDIEIIGEEYRFLNEEKIQKFRAKPTLIELEEFNVTAGRKLLINLIHRVGNTRYPIFGDDFV